MQANKMILGIVGLVALCVAAAPALATTGTSQAAASQNANTINSVVNSTSMPNLVNTLTNGIEAVNFAAILGGLQTGQSGAGDAVRSGARIDGGEQKLFHHGATGFSAQGSEPRFAVWGQYGYTRFDEDQQAVDSDGSTHAVVLGGDYRFNRWLIGGLAFVYDRTNMDTTFNSGELEVNGYSFAPYAIVQLIQNRLFLAVSAGYSITDQDAKRTNNTITSSADGDRFFAAANLTAVFNHMNWRLQPSTGILWARSKTDSYRESNGVLASESVNHFGRMHVGGEVGYRFARWEPFAGAKYLHDYKFDYPTFTGVTQPTERRSAAQFTVGTNVNISNRLTATVKGQTEAFRKDNSTYGFSGTLRYAF